MLPEEDVESTMTLAKWALRTVLMISLMAFVGAASVLFGYLYLQRFGQTEQTLTGERVVDFPRGTSLAALAKNLAAQGVVSSEEIFRFWIRLNFDYSKFQAGTYRFRGRVTPRDVADAFLSGKAFREVQLRLTIPEGFTLKQIIARAVALEVGSQQEFDSLVADPAFVAELSHGGPALEGYLFPETFHFFSKPTPAELLRTAAEEFWRRLPADYPAKVQLRGLTVHQAVIFASLIEKETPTAPERPLVSEVIWRRLETGLPLGIDAAIIYGIPNFNGNLTRADLENKNNPYNLRVIAGLPPTAICSPSLAALEAVLSPAAEGNLYYVVSADDPSQHVFAKTLAEHNQNVSRFVRAQRERRRQEGADQQVILDSTEWLEIPVTP